MKVRLTRAMLDELYASEVEVFDADPAGATAGKAEFVEAIRATDPRAGSATVTLTGEALVYAGHPGYGAFGTRADILSDWGPEYGSLARAFDARQRAAWAAVQAERE